MKIFSSHWKQGFKSERYLNMNTKAILRLLFIVFWEVHGIARTSHQCVWIVIRDVGIYAVRITLTRPVERHSQVDTAHTKRSMLEIEYCMHIPVKGPSTRFTDISRTTKGIILWRCNRPWISHRWNQLSLFFSRFNQTAYIVSKESAAKTNRRCTSSSRGLTDTEGSYIVEIN